MQNVRTAALLQSVSAVLVLLLSFRLQVSCQHNHEKSTLQLLVLAPYPDPAGRPQFTPGWAGGPGLVPAVRLAVEHINNNSGILNDYHVTLVEGHSGCDLLTQTFEEYIKKVFHSGKNIIGLIGSACSASTLELGKLLGPEKAAMAQVSISGSPLLTNRNTYPYSVSVLSSTGSYMDAFLKTMDKNNWNRIALAYSDNSAYHTSTAAAFKEALAKANRSNALRYISVLSDSHLPLTQLRQSTVRIILATAPPKQASKLMCLAYQYDMIFPTYQWVFIDRTVREFKHTIVSDVDKKYVCSDADMKKAIEGTIFLQYKLVTSTPNVPTYSGITYYQFEEEYHKKVWEHERELGMNITDQIYATTYYDATWAMALSLNNSIKPLKEMNLSLLDYQPRRREITDVIKQQFYAPELDFNGMSGRIRFDNSTGHSISLIDLFQVRDGTLYSLGYFDPFIPGIVSHGNGTFISDSFPIRYVKVSVAALTIVLVITAIQLAMTIFLHVINVVYWRHKSIKASSPPLNHLIFSGCYLMVVSVTVFALLGAFPPRNLVVCGVLFNTVIWSFNVGSGLVIGTVCVKTWRLYRIFTHFRKPGHLLSNSRLSVAVLLILLPLLILSTVVIIVDPPLYKENRQILVSRHMTEIRSYSEYIGLSYIVGPTLYFLILLACTLCISILSRHVRSDFNRTKSINFLLYTTILLFGIGMPLKRIAVSRNWNVHISYVICCAMYNCTLLVWQLSLFLPSVISLAKEKWPKKLGLLL